MKTRQIILLAIVMALASAQWFQFGPSEFQGSFSDADIVGWTATPGHASLVTTCAGQNLVGGFGKFSQGQLFEKNYSGLPTYDKLKINLTLYQIDSWDQTHQHGFDEFQIKIDNVLVQSSIKASGPGGGSNICGAGWGEEIVQLSYEGSHSGTAFLLTFTDTLNQHANDESWGISNLEIWYHAPCDSPLNEIGTLCLSDSEAQACHDHLDKLDDVDLNNSSIDNDCEPVVVNDEQRYDFVVQYNAPYFHNADCLTQAIDFEGIFLNEGNAPTDEWQFNAGTQQITFSVRHDDLESLYGCEKIVTDTQYTWVCDMNLHIYFGGIEQLVYAFQMKVYLARDYTNTLTVTVTKNLVTGDCCENTLNIVTQLRFCETFACNNYLAAPLTVVRKQDIFVEHSIVTPEFQYYYLHGLSLKLGAFVPEIINYDGTQQGRLIYHIQSNIAMDNMTLEAISRIDENPSRRRMRALQANNDQVGDDYKVKATTLMTIEDKDQSKSEKKQEKSDNTALIAVVCVVGVLSLLSIGGATFYCLKIRKPNPAEKYEQKSQRSSEEGIQDIENKQQ